MKKLTVKDTEQRMAFRNYTSSNYVGSIIAGTGFGKTRVGVFAAIEALNNSDLDALVLVPFDHLKDNFKEEMKKIGQEEYIDRIQFYCYASVKKIMASTERYCVVVCDEIHLGLTDPCFELYNTDRFDKKMFLTATLPEDPLYRARLQKIAPPVYTITIDECVDKGLIAPYKIKCVAIDLTVGEKSQYKTVNANFGYWKSKLGFDAFNMAQAVLANKSKYGNEMVQAALGFYRAIRQRKTIVDHAENKIKLAQLFANSTDGRILVFGGDNAFTDALADSIDGSVVYHSKKTKKVKDAALKDFKSGKSRVLCSTKALNQGLDIPNAQIGLICGLTSKALTMIQRVGRLVRIDPNDPKKIGSVIILYVQNSQEEKWLKNALKTTSQENIVWTTQEELLESV
jgi:superfamily II DNA or RNA helicase